MKVDVIVPAHNPGVFLKEALNSCMAQTYRDFNIIVIDDASTEDVGSIVKKYRKALYLRLDENRGPAAARNYGVKFGQGDLVSFLDADDLWEPKKLEWSVKAFQRDLSVGMTCGNYRRLENRERLCNPFYRRPQVITWERLIKTNLVASGSVTMRRDVFEHLGGFDENLWIGEDWKLWLSCAQEYEIKYIHKVLYKYSVIKSGNSLTNRDALQNKHKKLLKNMIKESTERMDEINRLGRAENSSHKNLLT